MIQLLQNDITPEADSVFGEHCFTLEKEGIAYFLTNIGIIIPSRD